MTHEPGSDPVEHASPVPFAPTPARLVMAIEAAGMTPFARIGHAAGTRDTSPAVPPTEVPIHGNPEGAAPMMLAAPRVPPGLPPRVLARQDADGRILVPFHPIASMLRAAGAPAPLANRLEPAQGPPAEAIRP